MVTKDALVTGAGRGLGLEMARQLLGRGYRVFAAVRDPARAQGLDALGGAGHEVIKLALDVTDPASIARMADEVAQRSEGLALLVNNAGINSMSRGIPDEQRNLQLGTLEPEGISTMIRTNAVGPLLVTQALLGRLEGAKVVHVSSWLGSIEGKTSGGNYGYCASKATLNMLGRALAHDLQARGIASVLVNPGWVQTDMGGQKAKLTPEQSVRGILAVADALTLEDSGRFVDHDGAAHAW